MSKFLMKANLIVGIATALVSIFTYLEGNIGEHILLCYQFLILYTLGFGIEKNTSQQLQQKR
jgi:hypothetical protein